MRGRRAARAGSRIDRLFAQTRKEKRAAFIPYLTGGDPDLETSARLLDALVAGGADLVEIGAPFSDPIADGPVNQRSAFRALQAGATPSRVLELIADFRQRSDVPVVLYTYYNPIHALGGERFAARAAEAGIDGILCLDLPPEEGQEMLEPMLRERGIDSVYLLAPTSTRERVKRVAEAAQGFVYYVSRTGVTGEREALPVTLVKDVKRLRRRLGLPVAVGFGISTPEQVHTVGRVADGVVVGSALVRMVEEGAGDPELPARLESKVAELVAGLAR